MAMHKCHILCTEVRAKLCVQCNAQQTVNVCVYIIHIMYIYYNIYIMCVYKFLKKKPCNILVAKALDFGHGVIEKIAGLLTHIRQRTRRHWEIKEKERE